MVTATVFDRITRKVLFRGQEEDLFIQNELVAFSTNEMTFSLYAVLILYETV